MYWIMPGTRDFSFSVLVLTLGRFLITNHLEVDGAQSGVLYSVYGADRRIGL